MSNSLPVFNQASLSGKKRPIVIGMLVIIIAIIGLILATKPQDFSDSHPGPEVSIVVANGEIGSAIATDLAQQGVVKKSICICCKTYSITTGAGDRPRRS